MKPSELIRAAIPLLVKGHDAPLYFAGGAKDVSDATYNCAAAWLYKFRPLSEIRPPTRWQRLAIYNKAARALEEDGR